VRLARAAGCLLTIDTDAHTDAHAHAHAHAHTDAHAHAHAHAHATDNLDLMTYGVQTARRGWAEASDVMNTRPLDELLAWLAR